MAIYSTYIFVGCIASIVLNLFFLLVTHLRRVEGFQEVLVFMRNISVGYILMAICLMAVAPLSIAAGASTIRIPFGFLEFYDSYILNAVSSAGCGFYLYTVICFCILFFYRFNVTCKTSTLSTIFSRKNILVFLIASGIFCFIQSVLIYYSAVDATYLREKLKNEAHDDAVSNLFGTQIQGLFSVSNNLISTTNAVSNNAEETPNQQHGGPPPATVFTQEVLKKAVFGFDYQRNPMIFLSLGIYTAATTLACIGIIAISSIVFIKLHEAENYGKESMSGKSKEEQIMLTKILMLTAYIPIILTGILAANFLVCFIRQKSMPFQELFIGFLAPWISLMFPVLTIILVPALRVTSLQILTCRIWKGDQNSGDSDINGNTVSNSRMAVREGDGDGKLSDDQLRALSNLTR